jgi:hypothetical protein
MEKNGNGKEWKEWGQMERMKEWKNGVKVGLPQFDGQWAKGQKAKESPHEDTVE